MNGSADFEANPAAHHPLKVVRRLYDAWNAGDVADAAELLSPAVRWDSFGASPAVQGPQGLQATLAGGSSGATRTPSPVTVDLLVCVIDHVIAFSRRSGPHGEAEAERLEVWTVRDGEAVHYRGYPLEEGLAVRSETTGSRRLAAVCRGVLVFNRGDVDGWVQLFDPDVEFVSPEQDVRRGHAGMRAYANELGALWPGQRLDDVRILAESTDALVISAVHHLHDASAGPRVAEPLNLVSLRGRPGAPRQRACDARRGPVGRGRDERLSQPAPPASGGRGTHRRRRRAGAGAPRPLARMLAAALGRLRELVAAFGFDELARLGQLGQHRADRGGADAGDLGNLRSGHRAALQCLEHLGLVLAARRSGRHARALRGA
jgi:ketosteroid isomerase-like protein